MGVIVIQQKYFHFAKKIMAVIVILKLDTNVQLLIELILEMYLIVSQVIILLVLLILGNYVFKKEILNILVIFLIIQIFAKHLMEDYATITLKDGMSHLMDIL